MLSIKKARSRSEAAQERKELSATKRQAQAERRAASAEMLEQLRESLLQRIGEYKKEHAAEGNSLSGIERDLQGRGLKGIRDINKRIARHLTS